MSPAAAWVRVGDTSRMSNDAKVLPAQIPSTSNYFPESILEELTGSQISALRHHSMGPVTVTLSDGREGTYSQSTNPQQAGWILHR